MNKIKLTLQSAFHKLKSQGFFFIFGSSTLNKIIAFASSWIIVRIISKPEYGVYTHAYNIYAFILLLNGFGITSAVLQLGSESKSVSEKRRIYSYGMRFGVMVDLVLAFAVFLVGWFVPLKFDGANMLLLLMVLLPLVTIVTDLEMVYLRINFQNKQYAISSTLNSVAVLLFSCVFALLFKAPGLVLAGYVSHLFTAVVTNRLFKVPLRLNRVRLEPEEKKTVYSIASISMLNNGLSHLMYLLDIFIIGLIMTESEVIASYKIATNIPTALQFIPAALLIFVYPHFARNKDNKTWVLKNYKRMLIPFALFNLAISVGLILIAEPLLVFVFGEQYRDAVIPFQILCASYFFSATFRTVSGTLLVTQRKLKFNLYLSVFAGILNSCLNVVLIQAMQVKGAAIATMITTVVCSLISTGYLLICLHKMPDLPATAGDSEVEAT